MSCRIVGGVGYVLLLISQIIGFVAFLPLTSITPGTHPELTMFRTLSHAMTYMFVTLGLQAVGIILMSIAWILLGRSVRSGVLIGTGVTWLVTLAVLCGLIAYVFSVLPKLAYMTMPTTSLQATNVAPPHELLVIAFASLGFAVLFFAAVILHIIAHFVASSRTNIKLFKIAGILHAVALVLAIAASIVSITMSVSTAQHVLSPEEVVKTLMPTLIIVTGLASIGSVIYMAALVLSAISFFMLKHQS